MHNIAIKLAGDESGQTLVEYGLIISLVALAVAGALTLLGGDLSQTFTNIANSL
jgi:pilus assembly protein Flp/PilA